MIRSSLCSCSHKHVAKLPNNLLNNRLTPPSSNCSAPPRPAASDSRFTDDDAVQQIRILCAQLLNLQDRVSVREVASATIATLLENCGPSHHASSTQRPPPLSPPMSHAVAHASAAIAALRHEHGRSGTGSNGTVTGTGTRLDKATSTSCDNVTMTGNGVQHYCHRACHVPLSAGVAMTRTSDDDIADSSATCSLCARCPSAAVRQRQTATIETYPSHCSIRCMCSENSIEELPVQPTETPTVTSLPLPSPLSKTSPPDVVTGTSGCDPLCAHSVATARTTVAPQPQHSNILVYAQLGNSGGTAQLEVDEELNRNSIVLDDTDYHANDCALEQDEAVTATATATATDCANGTKSTMTASGHKLVLDLSDRTKYTKEVSV